MIAVSEADRYTRRSILRSEQMYGRGFQGPNYPGAMEDFCALAGLREGQLAWGCFTGWRAS